MAETLKERTTKGVIWSFIDKFGQQVIYFISGILLARLLSPDDYGMVGGVAVFVALSNVLAEGGFSRVLINKENPTQVDYSTIFYFNLFVSIFIYLILFLCAPVIASFYNDFRIVAVVRVQSLAIIFNATSLVQSVRLAKKLDFKTSTRVTLIALAVSTGIALIMAYKGMEVWALVAQVILVTLFRSVLLWTSSSWKPSFVFSWTVLKRFFSFSNKLISANLLNIFFNYIYSPIIGHFLGMTQLGFYSQANKYQEIPSGLISNTFRTVVMPVFAEVKNENVRLKRVLSKNFQLIAFTIIPVMGILIVIAEPFFLVLIKEKWLPSVPLFRILCIGGIIIPFTSVINELLVAKERADIFLGIEIVKKVLLILLILALFRFGLIGLAASWSIYALLTLFISLYYAWQLIDYSLKDFIKDSGIYLVITVIACLTGIYLFAGITDNFLFIGVNILWISFIYCGGCYLFKAPALMEVIQTISQKIGRKP